MRCLAFTRYDRLGASSRVRLLQYVPYLAAQGIDVRVVPLLERWYLDARYGNRPPSRLRVANAFLRRVLMLLRAGTYDLLWVEKELFPFWPPWFEAGLRRAGIRYVADYDDATFHTYDLHPSPLVRRLMGDKIDRVMRHAAVVLAGNDYLAERAARAGARRVEVLPTVVDLTRYPVPPFNSREPFVVGWIGSPSMTPTLRLIEAPLRAMGRYRPTRLVTIGAAPEALPDVDVEVRPWAEETEVAEMMDFDVGVMPLANAPWERGKCGYKLIQYMACGKPVVASPVGVNREIVADGLNGYLAAGDDAWQAALHALADDPEKRRRMGMEGRRRVEARYALQVTAPRVAAILHEAAAAGRRATHGR